MGCCVEQVRAVQFNPTAVHLLASGGADGQVIIWDLTNPANPVEYTALDVSRRLPCLSPLLHTIEEALSSSSTWRVCAALCASACGFTCSW